MKQIIIPKLENESLTAQLLSLYKAFKNVSEMENLDFDLSELDWICPFLILPVSVYIDNTRSKFNISESSKIKSYLDIIKFPKGIDSISSFKQQIQRYKNYIPISVLKQKTGLMRERFEQLFQEMIYRRLGSLSGIQDAIYYPIGELITNIFEHSKQDKGYIFGQFYPKKKYLDICIVDKGRGFRNTYLEEKNLKLSDEKAIIEVMKGNSVKTDKERGYGIRTSKRIVCEALEGEFVLISNSVALISNRKSENLVFLPSFNWHGVIIAYRIPIPKGRIDIYPYIE